MNAIDMAKWLMRLREQRPPSPDEMIADLAEVFDHPLFLSGSEAERHAIMWQSSLAKFEREVAEPWDEYFGTDLTPLLRGTRALDLGCFTGGRSVAWAERYGCAELVGIDVATHFAAAARQFASARGTPARFLVARSETLPFPDETFDAVLSSDVFEHVQDVEGTLRECHRVLRPGGRMFVVFPGFYHPLEHHLSLVTGVPGIHYLFSPAVLVRAYNAIVDERGPEDRWYRRPPTLAPWERGNGINGTTARGFRQLVRRTGWTIGLERKTPIGRTLGQRRLFRLLWPIAGLLASVPPLDEVMVNRITYVLEKGPSPARRPVDR
jgi:SAM-dependent methyltransferase